MQPDSGGGGALPRRIRGVRLLLRIRRRHLLPVMGRGHVMAALALLLLGCAGPPGGSMVTGPLPEPPPAPPPEPEPETFAGRESLKSRIEAAGGFGGMVAIFDIEDSDHGRGMRQNLIDEGVPPELIGFPDMTLATDISQFEYERNAHLLERTRVAHMPQHAPFSQDDEPGIVAAHNMVWVVATGNTHALHPGGDRDFWRPDHHYWLDVMDYSCCANAWENHVTAFATGKAILATYAYRDGEGGYRWKEGLVRCGEMQHACFAIDGPASGHGGTSGASAKLAAAAFYVFQLYEKAEEVVDTLKACAEDIGEPGVDAEFGHGLVSLACERVENAEVLTASSSLVLRWDAPALDALLHARASMGLHVGASRWIADRDGLPLARLGAEYSLGALELSLSAGRGRAPLGVGSRYVHPRPAPYAAAGAGWRLWGGGDRDLRALFSAGRGGGALSPRMSRAGFAWRASSSGRTWTAYAGHARAEARVGIPGHREADRGRSPARMSGWEAVVALETRF